MDGGISEVTSSSIMEATRVGCCNFSCSRSGPLRALLRFLRKRLNPVVALVRPLRQKNSLRVYLLHQDNTMCCARGKIVFDADAFIEDVFAHQRRCCVPKHIFEPTNFREAGLVEVTLLLLSVPLRFHVIVGNYKQLAEFGKMHSRRGKLSCRSLNAFTLQSNSWFAQEINGQGGYFFSAGGSSVHHVLLSLPPKFCGHFRMCVYFMKNHAAVSKMGSMCLTFRSPEINWSDLLNDDSVLPFFFSRLSVQK